MVMLSKCCKPLTSFLWTQSEFSESPRRNISLRCDEEPSPPRSYARCHYLVVCDIVQYFTTKTCGSRSTNICLLVAWDDLWTAIICAPLGNEQIRTCQSCPVNGRHVVRQTHTKQKRALRGLEDKVTYQFLNVVIARNQI